MLNQLGPDQPPIMWPQVPAHDLAASEAFNFNAAKRWYGSKPINPLADEAGTNSEACSKWPLSTKGFDSRSKFG